MVALHSSSASDLCSDRRNRGEVRSLRVDLRSEEGSRPEPDQIQARSPEEGHHSRPAKAVDVREDQIEEAVQREEHFVVAEVGLTLVEERTGSCWRAGRSLLGQVVRHWETWTDQPWVSLQVLVVRHVPWLALRAYVLLRRRGVRLCHPSCRHIVH